MRPHLVFCAVISVAAGCSDDTPSNGCGDIQQECLPGDVCIDDVCRTVCVGNGDCDSGETCTDGACRPTFCVIGGVDILDGTLDPADPCRTCQPRVDTADYSPVSEGTACDDGLFCVVGETCQSGACTGGDSPCDPTTPFCSETVEACVCTPASCDDGSHCNGDEFCAATGECGPGTAVVCNPPTPVCSDTAETCVQCDGDGDCAAPDPSCVGFTCTACPTCPCPFGEHDGGDGACVPEGLCSSGFTRAYADQDNDGYTGPLSDDCFPSASIPSGWLVDPSLPPLKSFATGDASEDNSYGDQRWNDEQDALLLDGNGARCKPNDNTDQQCRYLVVSDLSLHVPAGATIVGITVHVERWAEVDSTTLADASIRLVVGGSAQGDDRADLTTAWPTTPTDATYGGPADLWGLVLTPTHVNDPGFGVAISAMVLAGNDGPEAFVDYVWVEVFTAGALDCNDDDDATWVLQPGGPDMDDDGFAGSDQPACVGATLPANFAALPGDCYDDNPNARPNQTTSYATHRGDGSFDYNCDDVETKVQLYTHDSCHCPSTVCTFFNRTLFTPNPACGANQTIYTCTGTCVSCTRSSSSPAVRCR